MIQSRCKHCGSVLPKGSTGEVFCCSGCEAAWRLIHNLGLEDFYSRKGGIVTSKVDGNPYIIEELFENNMTVGTEGLTSVSFYITSVRCAACVWLVENMVKKLPGITEARVNYATYRTVVTYNPDKISLKDILYRIAWAGHPPVPNNPAADSSATKDAFLRFAVGAFFCMQLMLYSVALYAGYFQDMPPHIKRVMQFICWGLATPVVIYTGWPFYKNSLNSLRQHHISMDVLVSLGALSAYFYSIAALFTETETYFETAATILTLITLGRYIELSVRRNAQSGIFSLFALVPAYARLMDGEGRTTLIPAAKIKQWDRFQVLAGERIPVDGIILEGFSHLDESMLTGEPVPKSLKAGDPVYAGTVNVDGTLVVEASAVGSKTVLARIGEAIEGADLTKTRIIHLADRVSAIFVPFILVLAAATFFIRWIYVDPGVSVALMHAVSVLVVACPCALGLAVPLAVTTAVGNAAAMGAIIKNGDLLSVLPRTDTLCFDKTGTLTEGHPEVVTYKTVMEQELFLAYVSALESSSGHILARAVADYAGASPWVAADVKEFPGRGVQGSVNGKTVVAGNFTFIEAFTKHPDKNLQKDMLRESAKGYSCVAVAIDHHFAGYFMLSDNIREDALEVLPVLRKKHRIFMLSGDTEPMVKTVADELNMEYKAAQTPFDKIDTIKQLQRNSVVVMVGDGINDAPALRQADGSIAVGQNASDIAVNSADVVLIRPDLGIIPDLFRLASKTGRIVKENLIWAFAYNIVAIPLAVTGHLHPVVSAVSMSLSSVIVVLNSLRARIARKEAYSL